jgi:hypothetical protein
MSVGTGENIEMAEVVRLFLDVLRSSRSIGVSQVMSSSFVFQRLNFKRRDFTEISKRTGDNLLRLPGMDWRTVEKCIVSYFREDVKEGIIGKLFLKTSRFEPDRPFKVCEEPCFPSNLNGRPFVPTMTTAPHIYSS